MVVKLREGQKNGNFLNNCKFYQELAQIQDINILRTISLSQETIQYTCFKPETVSLAQRSIHLEQNFSKNLKILTFIPKLLKPES